MAETRRHALARNDAAISGIMVISATPGLSRFERASPRREMIHFDRISRFLRTFQEKLVPPSSHAVRYCVGFLEFPTRVYFLPIFSLPRRVSTTPPLNYVRAAMFEIDVVSVSLAALFSRLSVRGQISLHSVHAHVHTRTSAVEDSVSGSIILEIVSRTCRCLVFHYRYSEPLTIVLGEFLFTFQFIFRCVNYLIVG